MRMHERADWCVCLALISGHKISHTKVANGSDQSEPDLIMDALADSRKPSRN